ncbi:MAG: SEC-C domain-containing protein [Clostridia bacterium]|nr:SEC-C domain-containing protein [Clostridia bacterium]
MASGPLRGAARRFRRNACDPNPCPCGSGKKYKHCCGR